MRTLIALALVAAPILSATETPTLNGNSASTDVQAAVQFYSPVALNTNGGADKLNLGEWILDPGATKAKLTFSATAITAFEHCVAYARSKATQAFPNVTGTKDKELEVQVTLAVKEADTGLVIDNPTRKIEKGTESFNVPITGSWEVTGAGSKTATITVNALYL